MIDVSEFWSSKLLDMIDRSCVNEVTEDEQATTDKCEINWNVDLNVWSKEKDMKKYILHIQTELMEVSLLKGMYSF